MKNILIFFILTLATTVHGQTITKDSALKVIYADTTANKKIPVWYVNGKLVGNPLAILNPNMIDDIQVIKKDTVIDGIKYYGKIFVKTKNEYEPRLLSLNSLKGKYTNLGKRATIFMIDGNIINADYDICMIDEDYIFQLIVDNIKNEKENIDIPLIKLLTKKEENSKKSNQIILRGNDLSWKR